MYHERRRRRGHDRQWHYESVVVPGTATIRRCHQPIKPQVEVKSMNHRRAPADAPCRHRGFIGWKMGGGAWRAPKVRRRCRLGWVWVWVLPQPTRPIGVWGSVISFPGFRAEPRPKTDFGVFWRPQNAFVPDKIWGGQFALASFDFKFCGICPPPARDIRPWST